MLLIIICWVSNVKYVHKRLLKIVHLLRRCAYYPESMVLLPTFLTLVEVEEIFLMKTSHGSANDQSPVEWNTFYTLICHTSYCLGCYGVVVIDQLILYRRSLRFFVRRKATFGGVGKPFFSLSVNRSRLCNWVVIILREAE